jgi:hypothetical protein
MARGAVSLVGRTSGGGLSRRVWAGGALLGVQNRYAASGGERRSQEHSSLHDDIHSTAT